MIIFGEVFTKPQAYAYIAVLVLAVLFYGFVIWHIIHAIRKERRKSEPIIYLYQSHYEVRHK